MISVADPKVQYFLRLTLDFLEDLDKEKLSVSQKTTLNELVDLTTEFYIDPQSGVPRSNIKREETYDDDGGIYGEIGSDIDDEEHAVNRKSDIKGEGAKILNLHASYKGWLRDDGWFRSSRWWALIWREKLLLYTDANTNKNPSKSLNLTKETKVTIKGPDKLLIEVNSGNKPKKFDFKVESGDINKWKSKLDEQIIKSSPTCDSFDDIDDENTMYDDMTEDILEDESPPVSPKNIEEKLPKNQPPSPPQSSLTKKKIPHMSIITNQRSDEETFSPVPQQSLTKKKVRRFSMQESIYENKEHSKLPLNKKKPPVKKRHSANSHFIPSNQSFVEENSPLPPSANSPLTKKKIPQKSDSDSSEDFTYDDMYDKASKNNSEDSDEKCDIFPSPSHQPVPDHSRNKKSQPPSLPIISPPKRNVPPKDPDSSEDITYDDMYDDPTENKSEDSDEKNDLFPTPIQQPVAPCEINKVPEHSRNKKPPSLPKILPPKRNVPPKNPDKDPPKMSRQTKSIPPNLNALLGRENASCHGSLAKPVPDRANSSSHRTQNLPNTQPPSGKLFCPDALKASELFKKRQELEKTSS